MASSWHSRFTSWYRYWRRRAPHEDAAPCADVELVATCKEPKRVDSGFSVGTSYLSSHPYTTPDSTTLSQQSGFIHLNIDFGDESCIKSVDYGTFSCWSAIEGLMMDMEKDGIVCEELWDISESMRVCKGDWDARVRPGWDIHVHCQDVPMVLETPYLEDDSDSGSEDAGSEEDRWIDDVLDHYREEWCLPRWRDKVEPKRPRSIAIQEPSRTMLIAGCVSVVLFIIAAIVYTS